MSTEEIAAELMATTPDPKTVREIAHDALTIAIRRGRTEAVEAALIAHGGAGPVLGEKFDVTTNAVIVEYNRLAAALSWPDEQPQDAKPGPYQLRDLTDDEARVLRARYEALEAARDERAAIGRDVADLLSDENLDAHRVSASIQAAIRQVRAELAQAQSERDGDVRAVARCQRAKAGPDAVPAMLALDARFADRIAALDARDAKAGEQP